MVADIPTESDTTDVSPTSNSSFPIPRSKTHSDFRENDVTGTFNDWKALTTLPPWSTVAAMKTSEGL